MLNVSFILWRAEACASFKGSIWAFLVECQQNKNPLKRNLLIWEHISHLMVLHTWEAPRTWLWWELPQTQNDFLSPSGLSRARLPDRFVHMTRLNQFNLLSFYGRFLVETSKGEPNSRSSFHPSANHIVLLWGREVRGSWDPKHGRGLQTSCPGDGQEAAWGLCCHSHSLWCWLCTGGIPGRWLSWRCAAQAQGPEDRSLASISGDGGDSGDPSTGEAETRKTFVGLLMSWSSQTTELWVQWEIMSQEIRWREIKEDIQHQPPASASASCAHTHTEFARDEWRKVQVIDVSTSQRAHPIIHQGLEQVEFERKL